MFKSLVIIGVVSFFTSQAFACKVPTASELKKFFGASKWTEIDADTGKKAKKNTIILSLNFKNIKKSRVVFGNKTVPAPEKVCKEAGGIKVYTSKGNVVFSKTKSINGVATINIKPGVFGPYKLQPSSSVKAVAYSPLDENDYGFRNWHNERLVLERRAKIERIDRQTDQLRRSASYQGQPVQRAIASSIDI